MPQSPKVVEVPLGVVLAQAAGLCWMDAGGSALLPGGLTAPRADARAVPMPMHAAVPFLLDRIADGLALVAGVGPVLDTPRVDLDRGVVTFTLSAAAV
jgi:hypothetical protein